MYTFNIAEDWHLGTDPFNAWMKHKISLKLKVNVFHNIGD